MDLWTKESDTRLQINQHAGFVRYIFGLPLLLLGLYFLYQYLILGIIAFIQAGDWWGLFSGIFGWLVIILLASLFVVPGWVIVFFRQRVIIDTNVGYLIQTQDFLIYKRVKQYRLDEFERIQAKQSNRRSTESTGTPLYTVELTTKDGEQVVVATDEYKPAKKLRGIIATMLGLKKSRKPAKPQVETKAEDE